MSFIDVYKLDTPAVSTINYGEKNTLKGEAVYAAMINNVVKFFGATWTADQIREFAKVCFDEWHYLTFAELSHFAKKAKTGFFKEANKSLIYGSFSPAVLIDWFCNYAAETDRLRGEFYGKSKSSAWSEPVNPVDPSKIKELTDGLKQQFLSEQEAERLRIDNAIEGAKKILLECNPELKKGTIEIKNSTSDETQS